MHIDQLTSGNWTQDEALSAVANHYNALAGIDDAGNVLVQRGELCGEDDTGWTPADDNDIAAILAREI